MCIAKYFRQRSGVLYENKGAIDMNILLVEDEAELAKYVIRSLSQEGHHVKNVTRGDSGFQLALAGQYDLLIVDRMLPGMDGVNLVKALREKQVTIPILFLSNLGGLDDRVEGLNSGGDDYLPKPFDLSELLARVNALLRRPLHSPQSMILRIGELEVDLINRRVKRASREIELQPRLFALLEYLMRRPDQIVTRTMLLEGVWRYQFDPKTNIVETHVSRLRSKIGGDLIQTVRGAGYVIRAAQAAH